MTAVVGIDLGTTNSLVAALDKGQPWIIPDGNGQLLLPSIVGINSKGELVVGETARRQYAAVPDQTVRSIKRQMGNGASIPLGENKYRPQELSAIILRALKQRAEEVLGETVGGAVITVPAYFTDAQRQATKEAGMIAGLEVLQILNEPTAAALVFDQRNGDTRHLMVYDLGGGTFDVSIVEISGAVTEVLASHGNNHLGGDDFDRQLQRLLMERFEQQHGITLPRDPSLDARFLEAAERAKIELSERQSVEVREAYLMSKGDTPLHLETRVLREDLERLIRPLLQDTLMAVDRALNDAGLSATALDQVILVGGSTRIPLVQDLVEGHLMGVPVSSFEPDRCVALGAALQAGVLNGEELETFLVDVTPHSLGIATAIDTDMGLVPDIFSTIIPRNTAIPTSRSRRYFTTVDNQRVVRIDISQGENIHAQENIPLGSFEIEGLPQKAAGDISIEVQFSFDLNGILTVTACETSSGQQEQLIVNNPRVQTLGSHHLKRSRSAIDSLFATLAAEPLSPDPQGDSRYGRELPADPNSGEGPGLPRIR